MKKTAMSLLLAASLAAGAFAGTTVFAEESSSEPITLSVWAPFTGSDGDVLRELVNNYNETNEDNITVELDIMDNDTLQARLPSAVSTGTGPSFVLVGIEFLQQYAENGLIEDISDFWETTGIDESNFYENVLEKSYIGDTLYGVPMQYNLQYLYYNKDIFEAAGLDPEAPPTTLDEMEEYALACTDASKNQYGLAFPMDSVWFIQYLWANGGDVISEDGTENLINSQENIDTLTWIQNLAVNEGATPQGLTAVDADTMFQAGQIAMYTSGPWNINGLNQLGINYGITAIPAGSDGAYSPEGGCSYMLTAGADDATREAVYKFMAYWLSDATLKEWSNRNGFPVWSYSVLEDEEIQANDILLDVSEASEIGRDWHLNLSIGSQIDNDVMVPMIEKILSGSDVTECLQEASDTLDGIIAGK
ncbi:MAG TPA: ABC transporter substrate-binding protein [Candidatus Choladousia intestinigallinarum]|nr:ABC transporter substrate-binding protein [Candidatus Choladousia intestinigallinarum]